MRRKIRIYKRLLDVRSVGRKRFWQALALPWLLLARHAKRNPALIWEFAIWCLVLSSEIWACYIIGLATGESKWFAIGTAFWAMWAQPWIPFFPICLILTIGTDALRRKIKCCIKRKTGS